MQPTPIVLPGDSDEKIAGAKVEVAVSAVAAWPAMHRN